MDRSWQVCFYTFTRLSEWVVGMSGVKDWVVLKTTQSGYEGFLNDRFTRLPETRDRIVASNVTSTWKYGPKFLPPPTNTHMRAPGGM